MIGTSTKRGAEANPPTLGSFVFVGEAQSCECCLASFTGESLSIQFFLSYYYNILTLSPFKYHYFSLLFIL